jgi:hypothetical protein
MQTETPSRPAADLLGDLIMLCAFAAVRASKTDDIQKPF